MMDKKRLIILFFSLAFIVMLQGLHQFSNAQDKSDRRKGDDKEIWVIKEDGPKGHSTIGIDEDSVVVDSDKELPLTFRTLMAWKYDPDRNTPPPEGIKRLNGRNVRIVGFMYPLQEGASIQYFCLLRTTQTCCYGPRPQYNQYVLVEMGKPTTFYRLDPVTCVGKFYVEPTPDEGFIFRIEGRECESIK